MKTTRQSQELLPAPPRDAKGRVLPGHSLNPAGRPVGTRNWHTKARDRLETALPEVIDKLVELALKGDVSAAKILVERCLPVRREIAIKPVDLREAAATLSDEEIKTLLLDCVDDSILE